MKIQETIEIYTSRTDLVESILRHWNITYQRVLSEPTPAGERQEYRLFGEPKTLLKAVESIGFELGRNEKQ